MATTPVKAPTAPVFGEVAAGNQRTTVVRWLLLVFYAGFLTTLFSLNGIPFDRNWLFIWILIGLLVVCVGRPWHDVRRLAVDWLPVIAFLTVYDLTRGKADSLGIPIHVDDMITADRILGFGEVPTVWLQRTLLDPMTVHWYDVMTTLVYVSHFLAVYVVAAVLWARNRARFLAFIRRFCALTAAGLATYILFPAAPPWYAAQQGELDPVIRASGRGWDALGLSAAGGLIDYGQRLVNQVAAMPSLHGAFAALICAFFWARARWPLRLLLAAYPVAMGFALVYGGEHYVIDVLVGWLYVWLVMLGVGWAERTLRARRSPVERGPSPSYRPAGSASMTPQSPPNARS
jgi:membrane-associated phospholipid phosphatase